MIMKLHAKTWSEDPFTYSLLNHYVHKPWQNIKRAYIIVACHLQYGSRFRVTWIYVEDTAQHCTVHTLTLGIPSWDLLMWFLVIQGDMASRNGRSWHYPWCNKSKPLQLLSGVACAPAFRYGKVVLLTKRLYTFLS